jgi:undecaprenyl-diphosphatase
MLEAILQKDIELLIYLNNLGTAQWDGFWLVITNKFSAIPLYFVLLYFTYKQFGLKKTVIVILFVALLITVSDQTSNLFKFGWKRLRPCHDENISNLIRLVKENCGGLYSFFSAHAANAMAIAMFFSLILIKKIKIIVPILIIWAYLVAYSRIYIGVHYPLDVVTGMFFGVLYGILCYKLFTVFLNRYAP